MPQQDDEESVAKAAIEKLSNEHLIFSLAVATVVAGSGVALAVNGAGVGIVAVVLGILAIIVLAGLKAAGAATKTTPDTPPAPDVTTSAASSTPVGRRQLRSIAEVSERALLRSLKTTDQGVGWSHFLGKDTDESAVTVLGTAYGLKALTYLRCRADPFDPDAIVDTLHAMAVGNQAWGATSQGHHPSEEATAVVLSAIRGSGRLDRRCGPALEWLDERIHSSGSSLDRVYVTSTVLSFVAKDETLASASDLLVDRLVDGTAPSPVGECCWGAVLGAGQASLVHTCRAVVALNRCHIHHPDPALQAMVEGGRRWIVDRLSRSSTDLLTLDREEVIRNNPYTKLTVRHFTPAWAAMALAGPQGPPAPDDVQVTIQAAVLDHYMTGGLWRWPDPDRDQPIWMTYQGLVALDAGA